VLGPRHVGGGRLCVAGPRHRHGAEHQEQHDLAKTRPKLAGGLRARLHAWRQEVGAQMPRPNPKYNPAKPEYNPPPKQAKPGTR
jgi:hypothetical protein